MDSTEPFSNNPFNKDFINLYCNYYLATRKQVLILGAGFGGLASANLLRKSLPPENQITVIDKSQYFIMVLVNLLILSGSRT